MSRVRLGLFLALCMAQLAIPLSMAYRYERTLREGAVYRFHTEPVDPVDAFRGRYVAIRLRLTLPTDLAGTRAWFGAEVYATLAEDAEGYAIVRNRSRERPARGNWLEGSLQEDVYDTSVQPPRRLGVRIELPFDRYYMEESKAPEADRLWSDGMREAEGHRARARAQGPGRHRRPGRQRRAHRAMDRHASAQGVI